VRGGSQGPCQAPPRTVEHAGARWRPGAMPGTTSEPWQPPAHRASARPGVSPALRTTSGRGVRPGWAWRLALRTTWDGTWWRPSPAHHLGAVELAGAPWRPGPVPSTTSGRSAYSVNCASPERCATSDPWRLPRALRLPGSATAAPRECGARVRPPRRPRPCPESGRAPRRLQAAD